MPTLSIKNVPEKLYQNLKQQAKLHHRSLNSEVIISLEQLVQGHEPNVQIVLQRARQLRAKSSKHHLTEKELKIAKEQGRL